MRPLLAEADRGERDQGREDAGQRAAEHDEADHGHGDVRPPPDRRGGEHRDAAAQRTTACGGIGRGSRARLIRTVSAPPAAEHGQAGRRRRQAQTPRLKLASHRPAPTSRPV